MKEKTAVLPRMERAVFLFYLFLLPFQLLPPLARLRDLISPAAFVQNDLFLLGLGMLLLFIRVRGRLPLEKGSLTLDALRLCGLLILLSTLTSLVLYPILGSLNGENTLIASIPSNVYLVVTGCSFYYQAQASQRVSLAAICRVFDLLTVILLAIGYFQALVLLLPSLGTRYDTLDVFGILVDSERLLEMRRICLSGSEPAAVGEIVNILLYPYLLGRILSRPRIRDIAAAVALLPLLVLTFSATVYMGLLVDLALFALLYYRRYGLQRKVLLALACLAALVLLSEALDGWYFTRTFYTYLLKKVTSRTNLSTQVRFSQVYADLNAFLHFPLTGVGNGNQGYFYNTTCYRMLDAHLYSWCEFADRLSGKLGIVAGGPFLPSFLSGYGLVGVSLAVIFVRRCRQRLRAQAEQLGVLADLYRIGGAAFLTLTTVSGGLDGNFLFLFVLGIPLLQPARTEP